MVSQINFETFQITLFHFELIFKLEYKVMGYVLVCMHACASWSVCAHVHLFKDSIIKHVTPDSLYRLSWPKKCHSSHFIFVLRYLSLSLFGFLRLCCVFRVLMASTDYTLVFLIFSRHNLNEYCFTMIWLIWYVRLASLLFVLYIQHVTF